MKKALYLATDIAVSALMCVAIVCALGIIKLTAPKE